jgi:hypothetical protein
LLFLPVLACLTSCSDTLVSRQQTDDLSGYLLGLDYGASNSDVWRKPDEDTRERFAVVFQTFLSEDYERANRLGREIGYEVIHYPATAGANSHSVLRETHALSEEGFLGGGTYVLNPSGHNVVIEVPHPVKDSFTAAQGIETYLQLPARLLMLAGTLRDASTQLSDCSDGHYRASDAAHQTDAFFYVAHKVVNDYDPQTVFLQLHGFGSRTLTRLQQQCGTGNDRLINLSEGVRAAADGEADTLLESLEAALEQPGSIEACIYGRDTHSLGGTWNVEGRYSNHSPEPCTLNAVQATGRFIHFEQSYRVREAYRREVVEAVAKAIERLGTQ